jgi:hypothetical protein
MKKNPVVLIVAISLVGLIAAGCSKNVNKDSATSVKESSKTALGNTFSDPAYDFTFEYPKDWTLKTGATWFQNAVVTNKDRSIDFASSNEKLGDGDDKYNPHGPDVNLAGVAWKAVRFNDGVPGQNAEHESLSLTTMFKGKNYQIVLYPNDGLEIDPIFMPIVTTFHFSPR